MSNGSADDFYGATGSSCVTTQKPKPVGERERFYYEMTLGALAAGGIGCIVVNALFRRFYLEWPNLVLVGVCFAAVTFLLLLFCGIVEVMKISITSHLGGISVGRVAAFACATAVAVGCAGAVLEFIYELGYVQTGVNYDDYIFVVDDSGSMGGSDPQAQRYGALKQLLGRMDESNQVGLVCFADTILAEEALAVMDDAQRSRMNSAAERDMAYGGTAVELGLQRAYEMYQNGRRNGYSSAVILLSDGHSSVDTDAVVKMFNSIDTDICTVALGSGADRETLEKLADGTGGMALEISSADAIRASYALLSGMPLKRCLLLPRMGADKDDVLHAVMCVVFLTLLGVGMMLGMQVLMNSKYMKPQLVVGPAATLLGALILEIGYGRGAGSGVRNVLILLYALVLIRCPVGRRRNDAAGVDYDFAASRREKAAPTRTVQSYDEVMKQYQGVREGVDRTDPYR